MRVRILFSIFQDGEFEEYLEDVYEYEETRQFAEALAGFCNLQNGNRGCDTKDHVLIPSPDTPTLIPPATRQGYGSTSLVMIKEIHIEETDNGETLPSPPTA